MIPTYIRACRKVTRPRCHWSLMLATYIIAPAVLWAILLYP